MNKYIVGFISGLIATGVITFLMLLKTEMGLMPELNVVGDFNQLFGAEQTPLGWVIHALIGSFVWGGIFALIVSSLPGTFWLRGVIFGIIGWLLMMVAYMPVMEHGLFATDLGVDVMIATLVLHIIFGFALGMTYGSLPKK